MVIYEHTKHGFHIISPGDDVPAMEAAGWFKSTHPSERKNHGLQEEAQAPEEVTEQPKRRGRPPKVQE